MDAPNALPVYTGNKLSRYERRQSGRKFGKYDFNHFHNLQGSTYFLGKGKIGQMEVACKFLFRKSHWGVLTPDRNPGGILYLDLVFTEPPGYYLRGATVILTLDEHDQDLQRHFSGNTNAQAKVPVHVTEHGPRNLEGQMKTREKFRARQFVPHVSAGGIVDLGGIGQTSEIRELQESQWRFSSQTMPDKNGRPTTLIWNLNESDLDRQPKHTNTFHTALAFEHDGQPFFMRVGVNGTLENSTSNLVHKTKEMFKKFKFSGEPQTAITLVNFGGRNNGYTKPLDELVQLIPFEMVKANDRQADQVQTKKTSQTQNRESDMEDGLAVRAKDATSHELPISPNINNRSTEEDELAEIEENARALMAFTGPSRIREAIDDGHVFDEALLETPPIPPRPLCKVDELSDESSQTAVESGDEPEQPKVVETSPAIAVLRKIRDAASEMDILKTLVQLIICLAVLQAREVYLSTTHPSSNEIR